MVDKGQRHTDFFSNMLTVFLSFGKLWTFWDSPYFVLLFKKVNHFGEVFMKVEMGSLRLAEDAKMKGSPSSLWVWIKYIPLHIITLSSSWGTVGFPMLVNYDSKYWSCLDSEDGQSNYSKRHGDTMRTGRAREQGSAFVFCMNNHSHTGFYVHPVTLGLH